MEHLTFGQSEGGELAAAVEDGDENFAGEEVGHLIGVDVPWPILSAKLHRMFRGKTAALLRVR